MNAIQDIDDDDSQIPVNIRLMLHRCLEEQNVSDRSHYSTVIIKIACFFKKSNCHVLNSIDFHFYE